MKTLPINILKPIIDFYKVDKYKLIRHLIVKEHWTLRKVANILDITPSAVSRFLSRNEHLKENQNDQS